MNLKVLIFIITIVILTNISGCQTQITTPKIQVSLITQSQLNDLLFPVDYGKLINRSLEGDRQSLIKLIKLGKHTSGGGSYGFGILLQTIALEIGDSTFAETITDLSSQELKRLHELLLAGFDYGDSRYTVDDFQKVLPKTYRIIILN